MKRAALFLFFLSSLFSFAVQADELCGVPTYQKKAGDLEVAVIKDIEVVLMTQDILDGWKDWRNYDGKICVQGVRVNSHDGVHNGYVANRKVVKEVKVRKLFFAINVSYGGQ